MFAIKCQNSKLKEQVRKNQKYQNSKLKEKTKKNPKIETDDKTTSDSKIVESGVDRSKNDVWQYRVSNQPITNSNNNQSIIKKERQVDNES